MRLVMWAAGLAFASAAWSADDSAMDPWIESDFGGPAGAAIANELSHRNRAMIGGVIGGVHGSIIFTSDTSKSEPSTHRHSVDDRRVPWRFPYDEFCSPEWADKADCAGFSRVGQLDEQWMPFVRGQFANEGDSQLESSIGVGFLYLDEPGADLLGIGFHWGEPNESGFGPGMDDQYTTEAFYRIPVTQQFAITPRIEYIREPASKPDDDSDWFAGVGLRLDL